MEVFYSAWNFDHFYPILAEDTSGPCMEAWTTLSALAQATTRIRIGCMVAGILYRHPAVFANMISSLDIISNGRLEVGLGAGWNEEECNAYGIELGSMKERFDRFDEALAIIRGMLCEETTTFHGKYYQVTEARNNPPGVQQPHPPICLGGKGERRMLPAVARHAQHWNYSGFDVAGFKEKRALLNQLCTATGRDPADIMTSVHQRANTECLPALEESCHAFNEAGVDLMIFYLQAPYSPAILEPLARLAAKVG